MQGPGPGSVQAGHQSGCRPGPGDGHDAWHAASWRHHTVCINMTTSHRVYTNTVASVLGTECQGYGDHLLHPGLLVNIRCSIMNHANIILSILWISTFHLYPNYLFIYVISITCRMVLWSFSVALKLRKSSWKMPHTRINNFTQLSVNSLCLISNCFLAVSRVRGCGVRAAQTPTECDTRHYRDHTAAAVARWLPRAVMDIMGRPGNEGPQSFHNHREGPHQCFHIY